MFLTQWEYRRTGKRPPYYPHRSTAYMLYAANLLACVTLQRHLEWHVPPVRAQRPGWPFALDREDWNAALDYLEMSKEDLQAVYGMVRDTKDGYFQGNVCMRSLPMRLPKWCLTELYGGVEQLFVRNMRILNVCTGSKQLSNLLGVPDITEHTRGFAYYVKTEWAYRRLEEAFQKGQPLSLREKAAVLEETFLY